MIIQRASLDPIPGSEAAEASAAGERGGTPAPAPAPADLPPVHLEEPGRVLFPGPLARAPVDHRAAALRHEHAHVVVHRAWIGGAVRPDARLEVEDPDLVDDEVLRVLRIEPHENLAAEDGEDVRLRVEGEGHLADGVGELAAGLDLAPLQARQVEGPDVVQEAGARALAPAEDDQAVSDGVVHALVLAARLRLVPLDREDRPGPVARRGAVQVEGP